MKLDLSKYAFVTEKNGVKYYRHIDDPKKEIKVEDDKIKKVSIKQELCQS